MLNMKLLDTMPELKGCMQAHKKELFSERHLLSQKASVFYFWSSECSQCKGWPKFVEQVQMLYGNEVQCVIIHVGAIRNDDVPMVETINLIDANRELAEKFHVRLFPAIYIFDSDRKLRFRQAGSTETRLLMKRIEKFLDR